MARLEKLSEIINLRKILEGMEVLSDEDIRLVGLDIRLNPPGKGLNEGVVHSQKESPADGAGLYPPAAPRPRTGVPPPLGCVSTTELHSNRKRKKFYIYILDCEPANTGNVYVGQTEDISDRIWQHIIGIGAVFTKNNKPCDLLHLEVRYSRKDALKREKELIDHVSAGIHFETDIPFEFLVFFDELKGEASKYTFNHLFDIRRHHFPIPHVKEWG